MSLIRILFCFLLVACGRDKETQQSTPEEQVKAQAQRIAEQEQMRDARNEELQKQPLLNRCKNIFQNNKSNLAACQALTPTQVEKMNNLLSVSLKHPVQISRLENDAHISDIETLAHISENPILRVFDTYDTQSAKAVLTWIAQDHDVADVFSRLDSDKMLLTLFGHLHSSLSDSISYTIHNKSFFGEADDFQNKGAIVLLNSFLERNCLDEARDDGIYESNESYPTSSCMLGEFYCRSRGSAYHAIFRNYLSNYFTGYVQDPGDLGGLDIKRYKDNLQTICSKYCSRHSKTPACRK